MFLRPATRLIRNSLPLTKFIKPTLINFNSNTTRTFFTTKYNLESFPSLPSPPSFPTTTTLNSTKVSSTTDSDSFTSTTAPIKHAIGKIERRLQITFTCTATIDSELTEVEDNKDTVVAAEGVKVEAKEVTCGHRSTHEFSKRSYDHGIVLIECPGCKNRHLIADNLSWFSDTPSALYPKGLPAMGGAKVHRTIEDLMREKGEEVKWLEGGINGGTWELEM